MAARLANSGDERSQGKAKTAAVKTGKKNYQPTKKWPWVKMGRQRAFLVAMGNSNSFYGCGIDNGNSQWDSQDNSNKCQNNNQPAMKW
jgi:hypothetical protein